MDDIKDTFERWESILRLKASDFEHEARKRGETVATPSIDEICNEMRAFLSAAIHFKQ